MSDITMCSNKRCEQAGSCYRVQAVPDAAQWYQLFEPEGAVCEFYIPWSREAEAVSCEKGGGMASQRASDRMRWV